MEAVVEVKQLVKLGTEQVKQIFNQELAHLTEGRWIEGDELREEVYTSHRFDTTVAKVTNPAYAVCVAAIRLHDALRAQEKQRHDAVLDSAR